MGHANFQHYGSNPCLLVEDEIPSREGDRLFEAYLTVRSRVWFVQVVDLLFYLFDRGELSGYYFDNPFSLFFLLQAEHVLLQMPLLDQSVDSLLKLDTIFGGVPIVLMEGAVL